MSIFYSLFSSEAWDEQLAGVVRNRLALRGSAAALQGSAAAEPESHEEWDWLFFLSLAATVVLLVLEGSEWLSRGRIVVKPGLDMVYLALLTAFAGSHELKKWRRADWHKGSACAAAEWLVSVWVVFIILAVVGATYWPERLVVPQGLVALVLEAKRWMCTNVLLLR